MKSIGINNKIVQNTEDVFEILDKVFVDPVDYWNTVYQDRPHYMSFLTDNPDENLVSYFQSAKIRPGKVLELGCGEGRNAFYMAKQGCEVEAIDISDQAILIAKEKAKKENLVVKFTTANIFDPNLDLQSNTYDLVYDSGLMHHLPPHRRFQYIDFIHKLLKDNGYLGLICFASGFTELGGPKEITDFEVYKKQNIVGGMAYSEERLRNILSDYFEPITMRYMIEQGKNQAFFGKSFLWSSLWRKK